MIIDQPGKVTDRILLLGSRESCVYLLKGKGEYALLGGGLVSIVPEVLEQLKNFEIEERKIKRIVILHAHFDHCGIVPFFKKRWPWVTVTASSKTKELLSRPEVIQRIEFLNRLLLAEHGREKIGEKMGLEFTGMEVEEIIKEGDILSCGDLSMEVIDVPGHSSCSIAIYVPLEKAMFASDAGGIPMGNKVFTAANSNFDKYQRSLEKMAEFEIDVYLAEHFGARTGREGRSYLMKSMADAIRTRSILEASYTRTKDVKKSTEEITDRVMEWVPKDFMPRDVIALVAGQMLGYIEKQMEKSNDL